MVSYLHLYRFATNYELGAVVIAVSSAVIHGVAFPLFAYVFGDALNDLGEGGDDVVASVSKRCLYMVYIGIGSWALSWSWHSIFTATASFQATRLKIRYFEAVLCQDIAWFDAISPAELPTRMTEDVAKVQRALGFRVGLFIMNASMGVAGLTVGFLRGWQVCLVMLAAMPIIIISTSILGIVLSRASKISQSSYAKAGAYAEEALSSIRTVTAFGGQQREIERYSSALEDARKGGTRSGLYTGISLGLIMGSTYATYALTIWYGGTLVRNGTINTFTGLPYTGGDILSVFFSVLMATFGVGQAMPPIQTFQIGKASASEIYRVIDEEKPLIEAPITPTTSNSSNSATLVASSSSSKLSTTTGVFSTLAFHDVCFTYPTRPEVQVLTNVSFHITTGMKVAFVGESGSGKSTVMALLERFYDPVSGRVEINGIDYREYGVGGEPIAIRSFFGYVGQEPVLFATSIRNNLTYGLGYTPSENQIKEACQRANVHTFISSLPNGYDTYCGTSSGGGGQISGGQKQRVAIARALLRNPQILLLDEATSALDNESEKMVQSTIDNLQRTTRLTTISIAHRLSTVRNSDIIFVMQSGVLVEAGKHVDLISRRPHGVYYALVSAQEAAHVVNTADIMPSGRPRSTSSLMSNDTVHFDERIQSTTKSSGSAVFHENDDDHFPVDEEAEEKERVEYISKTYTVPWLRLFALSKPEAVYYLPAILGAILSGLAMPLEALFLARALNFFFDPDVNSMMNGIQQTSLGFVGIAIGVTIGNIGQFWAFAYIGEHLTKRVRTVCYTKMLRQEIAYFDEPSHAPGRLTATLGNYALKLNVLTGTQLGIFAQLTATAIAGIIVSFTASPKLAAVMLATLPLLAGAGAVDTMTSFGDGVGKADDDLSGQANQIASEAVQNLRTVRALTAEVRTRDLFAMLIMKSASKQSRRALLSGFFYGLSSAMIFCALALGFWYGAVLIQEEGLPFDSMIQAVMGVFLSALGIGQALAFSGDIKEARTAAHDVFELLDRTSKCDPLCPDGRKQSIFAIHDDHDRYGGSNVNLLLKDVDFAYPHRPEVQVLKGLTLNIPAGQTIALVGPSGGGKSTVLALLQRFYQPDTGTIYVETNDINDINVAWWRSQCGLVSQEPVLFDLSLQDNVRYGVSKDVSIKDILEVSEKAGMSDFAGVKVQWDAPLGPRGGLLSGGQKQRVAIARALIRKPKLILLDEATSALDSASEAIVQKAIDNLTLSSSRGDKPTTVVIAHRLSTIRKADIIIVISEGRVVESGTHDELISRKGVYYDLYEKGQQ